VDPVVDVWVHWSAGVTVGVLFCFIGRVVGRAVISITG
jgi:hypothetical protein